MCGRHTYLPHTSLAIKPIYSIIYDDNNGIKPHNDPTRGGFPTHHGRVLWQGEIRRRLLLAITPAAPTKRGTLVSSPPTT